MIRDRDLKSIQEARTLVQRAKEAQTIFKTFSQEKVDAVFAAMAKAGYDAAEKLARLAVEETGYGKVTDKIIKNQFGSRDVYEAYRDMQTVGVINEIEDKGVIEIAEPFGVVAAIIPTTNPTSTALFKSLIAIKSRNGIVVSPHPRAAKCTCEAVRIMRAAAEKAGAPAGLIGCLTVSHMSGVNELLRARDVGVILATGGPGLVRAAYSAGKPAYGVGPGNVPVYIDRSAKMEKAIADVVTGKTFDWGTLCSSEQALVIDEPVYDQALALLQKHNAYFLSENEADRVGSLLVDKKGFINPDLVGHSPQDIARAAGFSVSEKTQLLVAKMENVGPEFPLSREKLSPVLAVYRANGWEDGCDRCIELLHMGGRGHTLAIHCQDEEVILQFGLQKPAFRIVVNTPSSIGAVGYTTGLDPSMTLGCGSFGGNITADNISPKHLMNTKRIAYEIRPVDKSPSSFDAWSPKSTLRKSKRGEFPYQKVFSSNVSRKGESLLAKQKKAGDEKRTPSPPPVKKAETTRVYGKDLLSGEQVDTLVAKFLEERKHALKK